VSCPASAILVDMN